MAKVLLTNAQKQADRMRRQRGMVADGLAAWKNRKDMTNVTAGAFLGVGHETVAKLLKGQDVKMSYDTFLLLIEVAGLTLATPANSKS